MDTLAVFSPIHFPEREFDQKADYRAEKREHLRGRNNVTLCRSPTRDDDTRQIKNQLKEKRQQEFLRRRSMSPELKNLFCCWLCTQEALWREEALKNKLALLKEIAANLINTSDVLWTSRCNEDLLRNKIKVLEAQLQVCLQKFPKDGVKKLMLQMEKQRGTYEERALDALQKMTQEKSEALSKAETLQEALSAARAEAQRWESLYKELKLSSGNLRENQQLRYEQLEQLHTQVELSKSRELELREEVASLRREKQELQYNICLLEEDNQTLREELQQRQDGGDESRDFFMQQSLRSEEAQPRLTSRRDSQLEEELRHTQEKLQLKEKECEELQTEMHTMEQECQSSQARLSQCRDELRQLSHRHRRTIPCGSWWRVYVFFLLLLTIAGVAMLWCWHPPFRDQVDDLFSDIQTRIEDYLMEMASPRHSGCFRPI
uniref:TRAF3 interacting protein 3 n=1 Tax=Nothobranchius pienaari TaxID=704102 RepID=A0A1A8LCJ2_9TELE